MSVYTTKEEYDRALVSYFTQITDKAFMSKVLEDRDCNTCAKHKQAVVDHPACAECIRTTNLSYWEPKVAEEQTCNNCLHSNVGEFVEPCKHCKGEFWQPKDSANPLNYSANLVFDHGTRRIQGTIPGKSDGSSADYYVLPEGATQLQDLISFRNMNAQMGEIFRATYRYGIVSHSPKVRDLKKIIFYAEQELKRIEKYGE